MIDERIHPPIHRPYRDRGNAYEGPRTEREWLVEIGIEPEVVDAMDDDEVAEYVEGINDQMRQEARL